MTYDFTHGNAKSLGGKLSARQYQSIHKCVELSYTPIVGVLSLGKEGARGSKVG